MESFDPSANTPIVSFSTQEARKQKRNKIILAGLTAAVVIVGVTLITTRTARHSSETPVGISSSVAHVTVETSGLVPGTVKIRKGQEVTWTNNDAMPHHLTADQAMLPSFDTAEPLEQGDTYTYIFDKAGTYHYYDAADPHKFVGSVTVE